MSIFTGLAERTRQAYTAFRTPVPLAVANPPVPQQKARKDGGGGGAVSAFLSGGDGGYYHTRSARALAMAGYMANPTVFRAVNILADVCASIPLEVTTGITKKVVQDNHPLSLLLQSPNLDQPGMSFRKWLISYWIIAGTSYIYGPTLGNKPAPTAWYLLRPDLMSIMFRPDLSIYYRYQIGPKIYDYDPTVMLVNKFFDPMDELHGVSPLLVAAAVIDRQNEGELFNLSLMKHAALPSGALVAPGALTDDSYDHLKDQVAKQYEGSENAGRVYLLEGGLTFTQMSMSPKDADWLGGDANAGRKIAMAIGVDPLLLNDKEHSTYNNVEQARTALIDLSAIPIMSLMLDGMNVYAQARYSTDVAIRMNQKYLDMLRGDKQATSIMMISEWNAGPRSFNETREGLGLDQVEGGDFHKLGPTTYVNQADLAEFMQIHTDRRNAPPIIGPPNPTTLTPASVGVQTALPAAAGTPTPALPAAGKPLALPAAGGSGAGKGHALPYSSNQTPRRVSGKKKIGYTISHKSVETWASDMEIALASFFADEKIAVFTCLNRATNVTQAKHLIDAALVLHLDTLGALFAHYYQKAGEAQAVAVAQAFKRQPIVLFTKEAVPGYADYAASRGAMVYDSTKNQVASLLAGASDESLSSGALQTQFGTLYDDYSGDRAKSLGRTEMMTASNLGLYTSAQSMGLPLSKTWVATNDERTRPSHAEADGQVQWLQANFEVGGDYLAFPGDSSQGAGADQIVLCRCTMSIAIDDSGDNPYDASSGDGSDLSADDIAAEGDA